jgi:hypothetical protein
MMQSEPPSQEIVAALHERVNQQFLYRLYQLNKNNRRGRERLFHEATDSQIRALIDVVRLLWTGKIPIKQIHRDAIKKSRKMSHIGAHFFREDDYNALRSNSISEQKAVLVKISTWKELLYNLFKKQRK